MKLITPVMPINRKALLRYKVIDRMLRNGKEVTLEELVYACSDEISKEITGGSVSRRTVQNDIQEMHYSEVLGYYAPIIVVDRKYYRYEDEEYSITKVPLSQNDLIRLSEAYGFVMMCRDKSVSFFYSRYLL